MNRRTFLTGLVATAAGVLVPQLSSNALQLEPERRIWALDQTMVNKPYPVRTHVHERYPDGGETFVEYSDGSMVRPRTLTGKSLLSTGEVIPFMVIEDDFVRIMEAIWQIMGTSTPTPDSVLVSPATRDLLQSWIK